MKLCFIKIVILYRLKSKSLFLKLNILTWILDDMELSRIGLERKFIKTR